MLGYLLTWWRLVLLVRTPTLMDEVREELLPGQAIPLPTLVLLVIFSRVDQTCWRKLFAGELRQGHVGKLSLELKLRSILASATREMKALLEFLVSRSCCIGPNRGWRHVSRIYKWSYLFARCWVWCVPAGKCERREVWFLVSCCNQYWQTHLIRGVYSSSVASTFRTW